MKRARGKVQAKKTPAVKTKNNKIKNRKRKKLKIFLISIVAALAVVFIALGVSVQDNSLIPIDTSTGKMNVLLLGVDNEGLRTDAIMIASYDFDTESLKMLSVPRDTKVYVTNRQVYRKINEVHAMTKKNGEIMGPYASIEAVTALTGIPINYYVEFSFDAIDHLMEILGPVTFDVPDIEGNGQGMNYDDPAQDLHIHLKPGLQELSGNQVQQFLRYRKSNNGTTDGSDTSRVERQQEFVKAIIEQKVNMSLIVKAPDIFSTIKKEIKTNFSAGEVAKYATHLLQLTSENISTYSLPGEDVYSSAWYFECDLDATKTLIETEFGITVPELTNRMEITGEKANITKSAKSSKTENPEEDEEDKDSSSKKTSAPSKTTKAPVDDDEPEKTPASTKKPSVKTEAPSERTQEPEDTPEPEKTVTPTKKPTPEPEPEDTPEPEKTPEPARPTAKPTQNPENNSNSDTDDDTIVLD